MFKVGQYVIRKEGSRGGIWGPKCASKGLDPAKPYLITGMSGGDPVLGEINEGSWQANLFDPAPPPDKDLEDYM